MALHRYDDARQELQRAIECKQPFGHAAEPWKAWALHDLEQATGNASAAADAWQQAVQCYLAYRAGGENHAPGARLFTLIAHAIRQGDTTEVTQFFAQLAAAADTLPGSRPYCPSCTPSCTATVPPPSLPTPP